MWIVKVIFIKNREVYYSPSSDAYIPLQVSVLISKT